MSSTVSEQQGRRCAWCYEEDIPLKYVLPIQSGKKEFCSASCLTGFRKADSKKADFNNKTGANNSTAKNDSSTREIESPTKRKISSTRHSIQNDSSSVSQDEDLSNSTTLTTALTAPTGACSSFNEFDWKTYLEETNSEASPCRCFKQFSEPPENKFEKGMILEAQDPRNSASTCVARVISKCGPRLLLRLEGADDKNDFWKLVDSNEIQAIGTAEKNGDTLQPPLGFRSNVAAFNQFLAKVLRSSEKAPEGIFVGEPPTPRGNYFKLGQKLEAVDMKNRHLICVATVEKVAKDEIFVSFDGCKRPVGYSFKYYSRDLFPAGWCKNSGYPLSIPGLKNTTKHNCCHGLDTKKVEAKSCDTAITRGSNNTAPTPTAATEGRSSTGKISCTPTVTEIRSEVTEQETATSATQAETVPKLPSDATKWSTENVIAYISFSISNPLLGILAELFRKHEIDGKALLLLNSNTLMEDMGLKLGPALKICNVVSKIKSKRHVVNEDLWRRPRW